MSAERRQSADRKFWFIGAEVLGGREGGVGRFHGIHALRAVAARERAAPDAAQRREIVANG